MARELGKVTVTAASNRSALCDACTRGFTHQSNIETVLKPNLYSCVRAFVVRLLGVVYVHKWKFQPNNLLSLNVGLQSQRYPYWGRLVACKLC